MQTNFSENQLKDKDNQSTEKYCKNVCTVGCATQLVPLMEY